MSDDGPWWLETWDPVVVQIARVAAGDRWVEHAEVMKRAKDARERECDRSSHHSGRRNR